MTALTFDVPLVTVMRVYCSLVFLAVCAHGRGGGGHGGGGHGGGGHGSGRGGGGARSSSRSSAGVSRVSSSSHGHVSYTMYATSQTR
jgi:hypothetical protein